MPIFEADRRRGAARATSAARPDQAAPGALADDDYWVVLTKAPTGSVRVTFTFDDQIALVGVDPGTGGAAVSGNTLTFDGTNWNKPVKITVRALNDSAKEGTQYSRIVTTINTRTT